MHLRGRAAFLPGLELHAILHHNGMPTGAVTVQISFNQSHCWDFMGAASVISGSLPSDMLPLWLLQSFRLFLVWFDSNVFSSAFLVLASLTSDQAAYLSFLSLHHSQLHGFYFSFIDIAFWSQTLNSSFLLSFVLYSEWSLRSCGLWKATFGTQEKWCDSIHLYFNPGILFIFHIVFAVWVVSK